MNRNTILPILLTLAGGMAVGSIHNAQSRGALPGVTTPMGLVLILATLLLFVIGLVLLRYYDRPGSITFGVAMGCASVALFLELGNMATTVMTEGSFAGMLFHEYLGLVVAVLQFVKLLWERGKKK
ncbi:MAG: hypothetical protein KGJ80_15065 [Chloroflexota bacterium]|nr:hypothetical protein [Chloroflexota bacterium]